jgi:lambda repressor-like predicted transcriptional regulator
MPAHEDGGELPEAVGAVADHRARSRWAAAREVRWLRANGGNAKPCRRTYIGGGLSGPKPLRFVLTDTDQPPLLDIPYPQPGEPAGDFWRKQWNRPFFEGAMELRLVIEGLPPTDSAQSPDPDVAVELEFDSDWTARHGLVREGDRWLASGNVEFVPKTENPKPLTYRLKRLASLDRHLPRIETLIANAIALDTRLQGDWLEILSYDWQLSGPRSRRGRKTKITADEIARLQMEGLTLPEIAERFGVHKKTPANVLHQARKRQIPALPNEDAEDIAES